MARKTTNKRKSVKRKTKAKPKKKVSYIKQLQASVTPGLKETAKRKGGVTIKIKKQNKKGSTSKRSIIEDSKRAAKAPGYRLSRNGKIYYESRKNRSDAPGSRT